MTNMQIEMLDSVSMAHGVLVAKRVYDLAPDRASDLVKKGLARFLDNQTIARVPIKRQTTSLPHGQKG